MSSLPVPSAGHELYRRELKFYRYFEDEKDEHEYFIWGFIFCFDILRLTALENSLSPTLHAAKSSAKRRAFIAIFIYNS